MFPTTHDLSPNTRDACLTVLDHILAPGNSVLITTKPHLESIRAVCDRFAAHNRAGTNQQAMHRLHALPNQTPSTTPQSTILILRRRRCRCRRWWCHNRSRSRCRWGNAGAARLAAAGTTTGRAAARRGAAGGGAATGAARCAGAATLAAASPSRVSTDQQNEQQNGQ